MAHALCAAARSFAIREKWTRKIKPKSRITKAYLGPDHQRGRLNLAGVEVHHSSSRAHGGYRQLSDFRSWPGGGGCARSGRRRDLCRGAGGGGDGKCMAGASGKGDDSGLYGQRLGDGRAGCTDHRCVLEVPCFRASGPLVGVRREEKGPLWHPPMGCSRGRTLADNNRHISVVYGNGGGSIHYPHTIYLPSDVKIGHVCSRSGPPPNVAKKCVWYTCWRRG